MFHIWGLPTLLTQWESGLGHDICRLLTSCKSGTQKPFVEMHVGQSLWTILEPEDGSHEEAVIVAGDDKLSFSYQCKYIEVDATMIQKASKTQCLPSTEGLV